MYSATLRRLSTHGCLAALRIWAIRDTNVWYQGLAARRFPTPLSSCYSTLRGDRRTSPLGGGISNQTEDSLLNDLLGTPQPVATEGEFRREPHHDSGAESQLKLPEPQARLFKTKSASESSFETREEYGSDPLSEDSKNPSTSSLGPVLAPPSAEEKYIPLAPLARLPPAPRYPCPGLTEKEEHVYLTPLYRRGWGVRAGTHGSGQVRELAAQLHFPSYRSAMKFVNDVAQIIREEKHHPTITIMASEPAIYFHMHTHSAIVVENVDGVETAIPQPGVTLRDVRLAMLVQQLFESYVKDGHASSATHSEYNVRQPRLRSPTKALRCVVCHQLGHSASDCPERYTRPPPYPCTLCDGNHWLFNCTTGMPVPPFPCQTCGGDHWHNHCPEEHQKKYPFPPCPHCGGSHWRDDCTLISTEDTLNRVLPPRP